MEKSLERIEIIEAYEELERRGIFDEDVEEDPEGRMILPGTVDYKQWNWNSRVKAHFAFKAARRYLKKLIASKALRIKEVIGVENMNALQSGAILTCNHFSPMDSFATQVVYEKSNQTKKRKLFRVIKEGNYTSFPGFFGYLMRNCNTLPLSSNMATMKEFLEGVDWQLKKGHFVLIYPEQSLWWNYRKPKPLKNGAFTFAAKANVPVLPIFICMEDSNDLGPDGFPIQEYTIFVDKPIYPDPKKPLMDNVRMLNKANYEAWKRIYEDFYKIPLVYTCDVKKPKGEA